MELILNWIHSGFSAVGPFLILLGLLIFVHELGHFLVAKWCGVRVEVFSLGFGKKILKYKRGDTVYCISIIPLGGYVKMYGDDPSAEIPAEERGRAFLHKPVLQRIAIVLAGPLMNFFFAIPLFIAVGIHGEQVPGAIVGDVNENSSAYKVGFRSGDTVLRVGNESVQYWFQILKKVESSPNQAIHFAIQHKGQDKEIEIEAIPSWMPNDNILSLDSQVARIEGLDSKSLASVIGVTSPQSWAAKMGLKTFDIITQVGELNVNSYWELSHAFWQQKEKDTLDLSVHTFDSTNKKEIRTVHLNDFKKFMAEVPDSDLVLNHMGVEPSELFLYKIKENSPADRAGLKSGDRILEVNHNAIKKWDQVLHEVKSFQPDNKTISFVVDRQGLREELNITPELTEVMNHQQKEESRFTVGIIPALLENSGESVLFRVHSPLAALSYGIEKTVEWTRAIAVSFLRLLTAQVSHKSIGGVITIGRVASQTFEIGISAFLRMMAIISINLFLINLLPVPILDGGHLIFFTIEALRGAPLSMRKMEIAQQVGLILLISLMVLSLFNDITNFVHSP